MGNQCCGLGGNNGGSTNKPTGQKNALTRTSGSTKTEALMTKTTTTFANAPTHKELSESGVGKGGTGYPMYMPSEGSNIQIPGKRIKRGDLSPRQKQDLKIVELFVRNAIDASSYKLLRCEIFDKLHGIQFHGFVTLIKAFFERNEDTVVAHFASRKRNTSSTPKDGGKEDREILRGLSDVRCLSKLLKPIFDLLDLNRDGMIEAHEATCIVGLGLALMKWLRHDHKGGSMFQHLIRTQLLDIFRALAFLILDCADTGDIASDEITKRANVVLFCVMRFVDACFDVFLDLLKTNRDYVVNSGIVKSLWKESKWTILGFSLSRPADLESKQSPTEMKRIFLATFDAYSPAAPQLLAGAGLGLTFDGIDILMGGLRAQLDKNIDFTYFVDSLEGALGKEATMRDFANLVTAQASKSADPSAAGDDDDVTRSYDCVKALLAFWRIGLKAISVVPFEVTYPVQRWIWGLLEKAKKSDADIAPTAIATGKDGGPKENGGVKLQYDCEAIHYYHRTDDGLNDGFVFHEEKGFCSKAEAKADAEEEEEQKQAEETGTGV